MQEYVNGFMVTGTDGLGINSGLFILKQRPTFQAGRWNGIGGKIEPNESPIDAMVREFKEETGLDTDAEDWKPTVILEGHDYLVHFFVSVASFVFLEKATSVTDEPVRIMNLADLLWREPTLPNMRWVLPLSLDTTVNHPVYVLDRH